MSQNYYIYRSRNIADEYSKQYKIDPKQAIAWLEDRLKKESGKIKHMVEEIIQQRGLHDTSN